MTRCEICICTIDDPGWSSSDRAQLPLMMYDDTITSDLDLTLNYRVASPDFA